jgi:hypothetical protein
VNGKNSQSRKPESSASANSATWAWLITGRPLQNSGNGDQYGRTVSNGKPIRKIQSCSDHNAVLGSRQIEQFGVRKLAGAFLCCGE